MKLSKRGSVECSIEIISKAARKADSKGVDLIRMETGVPQALAPKAAIDKVFNQVTFPKGYTETAGIEPLRQRIAKMYRDSYSLDIYPDRILLTMGASSAFFIAFDSLFDVGAKVAVPLPCYGGYLDVLKCLGLDVQYFNPSQESQFQPTIADLEKLGDIDGLLLTTPGNPTGSMLKPAELKEIVLWCVKKDVTLIVDEIYHHVTYGNVEMQSALAYSDNIVVLNSFSKYYAMPGWRLGWMVLPPNIVEDVIKLTHSLFICAPNIAQHVALNVMDHNKELDQHVKRYKANRDMLLEEMPKAGFDRFTRMDGAFYMYAHIKHLHGSAMDFCKQLIEKCGVVSLPGTSFDPINGDEYIRFSYAGSTENIKEACKRLQKANMHNIE